MRIKSLKAGMTWEGEPTLQVTLPRDCQSVIEEISQISDADIPKYDLRIEKRRKKRSLDSNAYLWVLLGKLSKKLGITPEEAYRHYVTDTAAYYVQPVRDDTLQRWIEIWESKGKGWIVEVIGPSKNKGWTNCRNYYGSSVYDSQEMSFLIDEVVRDCKSHGIETMTPEEIEKLKVAWGNNEQHR